MKLFKRTKRERGEQKPLPQPTTAETFDVPPETAEHIDEGGGDRTEDQVMGESSWLRSSG